MLIVALFHTAFNAETGSQETTRFIRELIAGPAALLISLAVVAGVAVLVTVFTREPLGNEPGRAAPRPAEAVGAAARPRVQ